jgi:hypothetical protein
LQVFPLVGQIKVNLIYFLLQILGFHCLSPGSIYVERGCFYGDFKGKDSEIHNENGNRLLLWRVDFEIQSSSFVNKYIFSPYLVLYSVDFV